MNAVKGTENVKEEWSSQAERMYKRVKPLGQGSFGTVWLAKKKNLRGGDADEYVAIKKVDTSKANGLAYANREITVLSEIHHPNIVRLIKVYKSTSPKAKSRLLVMSLARGPNLQTVVDLGGALGIPLARLMARQLIAAVGYLHGRAVLHRDIKPDNCILLHTRIGSNQDYDWEDDDLIWSDGADAVEATKADKWKLVLVDFGFARALCPEEVQQQENKRIVTEKPASKNMFDEDRTKMENDVPADAVRALRNSLAQIEHAPEFVAALLESNKYGDEGPPPELLVETKQQSSRRTSLSRRGSFARIQVRNMSAIGTKMFAAPEIKERFRSKDVTSKKQKNTALSKCVADYGMICDAYSVGLSLRVILTGVPAEEDVAEYIKANTPTLNKTKLSAIFSCAGSGKKLRRQRIFRQGDNVPMDAARLVRDLTREKAEKRMTVREAQLHPWICGGKGEEPYEMPCGDMSSKHGDPVVFLNCAS